MTTLCKTLLSDLGVLGSIEIQEFQLGFIPLEKDVLSLEMEDVWKKLELVSPFFCSNSDCDCLLKSVVEETGRRLLTSLRYGQSFDDSPKSLWVNSQNSWKGRFCFRASIFFPCSVPKKYCINSHLVMRALDSLTNRDFPIFFIVCGRSFLWHRPQQPRILLSNWDKSIL